MDEQVFWVLVFETHRLLGPFTPKEACVTLRVLDQIKGGNYDIIQKNNSFHTTEIVTGDFRRDDSGRWSYEPRPQATSESLSKC